MSFAQMSPEEAQGHSPQKAILDEHNRPLGR
jgi:hypothetical protein